MLKNTSGKSNHHKSISVRIIQQFQLSLLFLELSCYPAVQQSINVSSTNQTSVQLLNISPTDLGCSWRATWPRQSCQPVCCVVDQRCIQRHWNGSP